MCIHTLSLHRILAFTQIHYALLALHYKECSAQLKNFYSGIGFLHFPFIFRKGKRLVSFFSQPTFTTGCSNGIARRAYMYVRIFKPVLEAATLNILSMRLDKQTAKKCTPKHHLGNGCLPKANLCSLPLLLLPFLFRISLPTILSILLVSLLLKYRARLANLTCFKEISGSKEDV